jgi:O-antigen/teichoic acid export membrane protein
MRQSQRILKNVLAGGFSTAGGGILQFVAILLIARNLSVHEFGLYSFMATLAFVLFRLSDMGVSAILTRDLAVDPAVTDRLLSAALSLAWMVALAFTILSLVTISFVSDRRTALLVAAMGLAGVMQFPCGCYGAVLRAREENELDGLGFLLHKVILLGLVFLTFKAGGSLVGVVLAYIISAVMQCLFYHWMVTGRCARPRLSFDVDNWRYLLSHSWPFGVANSVRLLGEQADVTILAWLASFSAVGLYSGPYKITVGLRFIPEAMVIALLPIYSRAASRLGRRDEFQQLYERGVRVFVVLALAVVIFFAATPQTLIVGLLGSRYAISADALRLLAIVAGICFVGAPFPYLLTTLSEQRFLLISSVFATGVRILLDLVLTRYLGFTGPCYAVIVSEGLLLCLWINYLTKLGFTLPLAKILWRPGVAAIVIGFLLNSVNAHSLRTLIPLELAGAALYFGVVVILGEFTEKELELAREGLGFVTPFAAQWSRQLRSNKTDGAFCPAPRKERWTKSNREIK